MIFPARMRKVEILSLKEDKDSLLNDLYDLESVEVIECEACEKFEMPSQTRESTSKAIQIDRILNFLGHYVSDKKISFLDTLKGKHVDKEDVTYLSTEEILSQTQDVIAEIESPLKKLETDIGVIEEEVDVLKEYLVFLGIVKDIGIEVELLQSSFTTFTVIGEIFGQDTKAIEDEIYKATDGFCHLSFWKNLVFITIFKEDERKIDLILSNFSIKRHSIPDIKGKPHDLIPEIEQKIKHLLLEKNRHTNTIKELSSKWDKKLRVLKELLEVEAEKANAFRRMASTKNVVAIEGYFPAKKEKTILDRLLKYDRIFVRVREPDKEPSIMLDNKRIFKPFETLTELYGVPRYNEIDPTIFFAIFFSLFFGIMMTDFVYGMAIGIIGFILLKNVKKGGLHDVAVILFYGGVSAMICGMAFGSYLGDFVTGENYLNIYLPKVVDPLYGAMSILIFSLGIGLLHLSLSNILGIYQKIRNGEVRNAFIDNLPWLLCICSITGAAFSMLFGCSIFVFKIVAGVPIAFAVAIVMISGIKNGLAGIIIAFMSLPGFLGNWLSYARLLALALSTAGIAMVMNLFASMMWNIRIGGIHVGIIFAVIMFVGGHIFNIAINGLGAFVHSLRLHYVEFFSYFYNAEGRKFKPLQVKRTYTRYTTI
ncbi:MAG: V-type ATP synthase subunit I [Candidatus Methanofastidiosia archaeon]